MQDNNNYAVLDSACSSTVCGENWLNKYQESLSICNKSKVKLRESRTIFKFFDESKLKSKGEYWLPAVLADKEVTIKTDVVESDIPLLLSKRSLKRAGVKIEIEKDTASIFGKYIALKVTSSG